MSRSHRILAGLAGALALVAVGCSSDDGSGGSVRLTSGTGDEVVVDLDRLEIRSGGDTFRLRVVDEGERR